MREKRECIYYSEYFRDQILKSFLATILNQGTETNYKNNIRMLCNYLQMDFLEITEEDANRYMQHLYSLYYKGELSRRTSNVRLSTYKTLSNYIEATYPELGFSNPFSNIKSTLFDANVPITHVPSMKDVDLLMSAVKDDEMYYLILALAGRAALTAGNIVRINRNNMLVDEDGTVILTFPPSNNFKEPFSVIMPSDVSSLLISYINTHESPDGSGYVFFNRNQKPLRVYNIDMKFQKILKKSGVSEKYTIKDLRTRAIIDMKKNGVSTQDISAYTNLSAYRVGKFSRAASFSKMCPADLVNYKLKEE